MNNNAESKAYPRFLQETRIGDERLHSHGKYLNVSVLDFWRWSSSDLLSNTARGVFAEFIVANALEIPLNKIRAEWDAFDLLTPERIKVEVKSAAFIQSWYQAKLTAVSFRVPKTRAWNPDTNTQELESRRQADVYVFALLEHQEQETIDPLDLNQWHFYVLPTSVLNERTRSQHSITLKTLDSLSGGAVSYADLRNAVLDAYHKAQ